MTNYQEAREIINTSIYDIDGSLSADLSRDDKLIKIGYNLGTAEQDITLQGILSYLAKKHATKNKNCFNFSVSHNAKGDGMQFLTIQLEEYGRYGVLDIDISKDPRDFGDDKWGEILKLLS